MEEMRNDFIDCRKKIRRREYSMAEQAFQKGLSCIVMHDQDNVATLLKDCKKDEVITYIRDGKAFQLTLIQDIPFGHKVSITVIRQNEKVIKYGEVIGAATIEIPAGTHVHVHNIEGIRGRGDIGRGGGKEFANH